MIWSTDLDETLELENLIDQAALESYSAEARKELVKLMPTRTSLSRMTRIGRSPHCLG